MIHDKLSRIIQEYRIRARKKDYSLHTIHSHKEITSILGSQVEWVSRITVPLSEFPLSNETSWGQWIVSSVRIGFWTHVVGVFSPIGMHSTRARTKPGDHNVRTCLFSVKPVSHANKPIPWSMECDGTDNKFTAKVLSLTQVQTY